MKNAVGLNRHTVQSKTFSSAVLVTVLQADTELVSALEEERTVRKQEENKKREAAAEYS